MDMVFIRMMTVGGMGSFAVVVVVVVGTCTRPPTHPSSTRPAGKRRAKERAIYALGFERCVEADIRDGDGHPGEEVCDRGQVLEPGEDCF